MYCGDGPYTVGGTHGVGGDELLIALRRCYIDRILTKSQDKKQGGVMNSSKSDVNEVFDGSVGSDDGRSTNFVNESLQSMLAYELLANGISSKSESVSYPEGKRYVCCNVFHMYGGNF